MKKILKKEIKKLMPVNKNRRFIYGINLPEYNIKEGDEGVSNGAIAIPNSKLKLKANDSFELSNTNKVIVQTYSQNCKIPITYKGLVYDDILEVNKAIFMYEDIEIRVNYVWLQIIYQTIFNKFLPEGSIPEKIEVLTEGNYVSGIQPLLFCGCLVMPLCTNT